MFPVGDVRKIRFHHLRHTTASLLLMSGAELAAVQRIMRHQDPRITTEVYGHLAADYLKREVERLHFGPPAAPSQDATSPPQLAQEPRTHVAAGGAPESPLPAANARAGAPAAPLVTRLLPTHQKGRSAPIRPRTDGKDRRRLSLVGVAGFEPTTSCSQIHSGGIAGGGPRLQAAENISGARQSAVQRSQVVAPNSRPFVPSHVPGLARVSLAALMALHGRRRLLTVAEVAKALAVSTATVYALCARGRVKYVRILNQIRVPPAAVMVLFSPTGDRGR
jgi:excisionase family DNA binding protein